MKNAEMQEKSDWKEKCSIYSLGEGFGTLNMSEEGLIKA